MSATWDVSGPYQLFPAMSEAEFVRLREDIAARGVLVPVEYTSDGAILDGHHRVAACRELGISTYPRVVRHGMTRDEALAHVIAVNVHRRHLSATARRQWLAQLRARGWSGRRIATETGLSEATVRRDLAASGASNDAPESVTGRDGKQYPARRPTSVIALSAHQQVRASAALADFDEAALNGRVLDLRRAERLARGARASVAAAAIPAVLDVAAARVELGDFRDLDIEAGSVDLICTDPPYTLAAMPVWSDLGERAATWLKPGGVLVAYCGQLHLPEAIARLSEHLEWGWMLAAVHSGGEVTQIRQRHLGSAWKPVLMMRAPGGSEPTPWFVDVVRGGGRSKSSGHPWEQAVSESGYLIESLTTPGDLVLDPFTGSGTTGVAAVLSGRQFIGAEIDRGFWVGARERISQASSADVRAERIRTSPGG